MKTRLGPNIEHNKRHKLLEGNTKKPSYPDRCQLREPKIDRFFPETKLKEKPPIKESRERQHRLNDFAYLT